MKKYRYYNRDLSWISFNHRVLQEMMDKRNPVFERLKFAAIFSSNLDEFFIVRVAEIRRIKSLDKPLRKKLITKPNKLLKAIKTNIYSLQKQFDKVFSEELLPELKSANFHILLPSEYDSSTKKFCKDYFEKNIKKDLVCKTDFKTDKDRLFIKTGQVYLVAQIKEKLVVCKLPTDQGRFVPLDPKKKDKYIFLDDLIKENLKELYGQEFYSMEVSRDAELHIDNEYGGNLKEKIEKALSNRDTGQISAVMIDKELPRSYVDRLYTTLDISDTDVIFSGKYHRLKDIFSLDLPDSEAHHMIPLPPIRSSRLACHNCMLSAIREKDRLLYYPYESFEEVIRFVAEASTHPDVEAIKVTLYRVSKTSAIAKGLLEALNNGKKVCVFIETKARFDESNNIYWGEKLRNAGAKVIFSYPEIKVHSKIMYVRAKNEKGVQEYAYIGTGNFNEKTSKVYTDYGLMTAHKKITAEIGRIFELLEGKILVPKTKNLLVSPFTTRSTINEMIQNEINNAKIGNDAYLMFKMNSLQDRDMIKRLYKASNAGVKIQLQVRGICCLIPGVMNMSENIKVYSIVDRFLEHGRVYVFGNNGDEKMYIGSADLMTRNLDNRIEVLVPILDKDIFSKISVGLQMQLEDNVKRRIIGEGQVNEYVSEEGDYQNSSQHRIYELLNSDNA